MDILFEGLDLSAFDTIPRFRTPTRREIAEWIRQTEGVWTNEILEWLGRPVRPDRAGVKYHGPLTLAQQWWIIGELQDLN
jgi:hypothetical protein